MKILNLYAGIGGNRKFWDECDIDLEITAVENNVDIAKIYQDFYPEDKVIVADAHQFLLDHYKKYDFIWSSPPCPSHSDIRRYGVHKGQFEAIYPDLKLWQEIILLKHFAAGKWVVENVKPYYESVIQPTFKLDRHYFWSNFRVIQSQQKTKREVSNLTKFTNSTINFGFDLRKYKIKNKRQILRNIVNPETGLHILNQALERIDTRIISQTDLFVK